VRLGDRLDRIWEAPVDNSLPFQTGVTSAVEALAGERVETADAELRASAYKKPVHRGVVQRSREGIDAALGKRAPGRRLADRQLHATSHHEVSSNGSVLLPR
jgi:hypothetical protein